MNLVYHRLVDVFVFPCVQARHKDGSTRQHRISFPIVDDFYRFDDQFCGIGLDLKREYRQIRNECLEIDGKENREVCEGLFEQRSTRVGKWIVQAVRPGGPADICGQVEEPIFS